MSYIKIGEGLHNNKYRPDIDGIRSIAVSSVVLCHAFPQYIPGGFIGVDIFFVISGYLITNIILKDIEGGNFSILRFYDRRIRRIFPALILVLLSILALGWFCLFRTEFVLLGRHVAASSLFSENLLLWSEASYFDVSSSLKPTLHLWSLAIEEQFYILWPIVLYAAHRWRFPYFAVFVGFAGLSFIINLHDLHVDPTAAYYSPLGRSWELMAGSLLAYIQLLRPQMLVRHRNAQSIAGLILVALALATIRPETPFPGFWALLPVGGTLLLISCGGDGWVNRRLLALPPMVYCGLISYPLYLWHWFFISYANILFGSVSVPRAVECVLASVILATLTFLYIERPLRTRGGGRTQPLALLTCMLAVLGVALLIATQTIRARLQNFDVPKQNEWSFLRSKAKETDTHLEANYPLGGNRSKTVLFIGDSHIAQYAARLNRVMAADPTRPGAILAIGGGCIPLEGVKTDDPMRSGCWPLRDQAYRLADETQFKRIVIGGAWNWYMLTDGYFYQYGNQRLALTTDKGRKAALDRLAEHIKAWQRAGKQVIFVLDNPKSPALSSIGWRTRFSLKATNYPANGVAQISSDQINLRRYLAAWASNIGVQVIDPFSVVCAGGTCSTTTSTSLPIFKDDGHFNPDWSINHATFVDMTIDPIVGD